MYGVVISCKNEAYYYSIYFAFIPIYVKYLSIQLTRIEF